MAECQQQRPGQSQRQRPNRPPPPSQVQISDVKTVEKVHDEAYKLIDKGLKVDEEANKEEAVRLYESGLCRLCQALAVDSEKVTGSDEDKTQVQILQQKMLKTKLQIEYRYC